MSASIVHANANQKLLDMLVNQQLVSRPDAESVAHTQAWWSTYHLSWTGEKSLMKGHVLSRSPESAKFLSLKVCHYKKYLCLTPIFQRQIVRLCLWSRLGDKINLRSRNTRSR